MQDAYHLGGWGMYPTTIFGFVLLAFAVQYARNPERRRLLVLRHLNVLVAMSGLLGFTAGCINTFTHVEGDKTFVAIIGVGESLVNVGLSLVHADPRTHHHDVRRRTRCRLGSSSIHAGPDYRRSRMISSTRSLIPAAPFCDGDTSGFAAAKTLRIDALVVDARFDEPIAHRGCALVRQRLILVCLVRRLHVHADAQADDVAARAQRGGELAEHVRARLRDAIAGERHRLEQLEPIAASRSRATRPCRGNRRCLRCR